MEVLPEVQAAAQQLAAVADEHLDLVDQLEAVSRLMVTLLPACVGVSITVMADGDPFTVTATAPEIQGLDATQYLDGGPCVEAARTALPRPVADVLDEGQWLLYGQAAAAAGVRSSLSLPLRGAGGRALGALDLHGGEVGAFQGKEAALAELFGVHVGDLVRNADLPFRTREFARELPQRLLDHEKVNRAVGVLVERRGWSAAEARQRMEFAAGSAGTPVTSVADVVMVLGFD